jgi:glycine cleavage system H protein
MYPTDYRYTKDHQWVKVQGAAGTIGITAYAQEQLGDVIFVNLPKIGEALKSGEAYGEIESVKAVSDLYAPVSGEVAEVNTALAESPEIVNKDPHGGGWLVKIRLRDPQDISALMDASAYQQYTAEIAT